MRRRIEELVRCQLNAATEDSVQAITGTMLRRSADYMLQIQRTQDQLQNQVERERERCAVTSQRLQAEREKVENLSSALTYLEAERDGLKCEVERLQRSLEDRGKDIASLRSELESIEDERDDTQYRHNMVKADFDEALRLVAEHARAEEHARATAIADMPPQYDAIQHVGGGPVLDLAQQASHSSAGSVWQFHDSAMQCLFRQSRDADREHVAGPAFKLLAGESVLLSTHLIKTASREDAATAILTLCRRTLAYPLFEEPLQWDMRAAVQHLWRTLDESLNSSVDVSLQCVPWPGVQPCPQCSKSACGMAKREQERTWRHSRLAMIKHLRLDALFARLTLMVLIARRSLALFLAIDS